MNHPGESNDLPNRYFPENCRWVPLLNHFMTLHVHKDRTDALTLVDVANDFVVEKENRKQLFGKFSANDIPNKFSISSKSTQTEN